MKVQVQIDFTSIASNWFKQLSMHATPTHTQPDMQALRQIFWNRIFSFEETRVSMSKPERSLLRFVDLFSEKKTKKVL